MFKFPAMYVDLVEDLWRAEKIDDAHKKFFLRLAEDIYALGYDDGMNLKPLPEEKMERKGIQHIYIGGKKATVEEAKKHIERK